MKATNLIKTLLLGAMCLLPFFAPAFPGEDDSLVKKPVNGPEDAIRPFQLCRNVVGVMNPNTRFNENYIYDAELYAKRVDTLPQVIFWRHIMNLHKDSALISIGETREIIGRVKIKEWESQPESQKKYFRDSVKLNRGLDTNARILMTAGKKFFYDFEKTSVNFHKGIQVFMDNNVDPWYAQAILLIESPNKLQKSNVGAYGAFQLMPDVARMYGLKVNRHIDERANFERSAYAASSLIKNICIPRARLILDSLGITNVVGDELWFRLLVMHVYHAGYYNVQKAVFTFNPSEGDMAMIYTLWHTSAGKFKSASQNYSQLVLAAMLEMDQRSGVKIQMGQEN